MKKIAVVLLFGIGAFSLAGFNFNAALSLYGGATFERGDILRTSGNLLLKAAETIGGGEVKATLDVYCTTLEGDKAAYLIRELYYRRGFEFEEKFVREFELRAGFEKHTWGKSDELRVLDILNPQYLNFVLFDKIEERKIGRFTLAAGLSFGQKSKLEVLFLPVTQASVLDNRILMPKAMQELYTLQSMGSNTIDESLPGLQDLSASSVGARLKSQVLGFDIDFYFYSGSWTQPRFVWTSTSNIHRQYNRVMLAGFDFERNVGSFVFRGEVAWFFSGRSFSMNGPATMMDVGLGGGNGILEKDYVQVVVGFDSRDFLLPRLYCNLQYGCNRVLAHDARMLQEATEHLLTARLEYTLCKEALALRASAVWYLSRGFQVNPEIGIKLDSGTTLNLGAWLINTDREDYLLGSYDNLDFAYLSFVVNF